MLKKCIAIVRFSDSGFEPKLQTYHLEDVEFLKNKTWEEDSWFDENDRKKKREKLTDINENFKEGVWAFIDGEEDKYFLNHLDLNEEVPYLSCYEAEIPLDAVVYKSDEPYLKSSISTVREEMSFGSFFIPKETLSEIINIKEIENRYMYE